jgi:hypothetical protein
VAVTTFGAAVVTADTTTVVAVVVNQSPGAAD